MAEISILEKEFVYHVTHATVSKRTTEDESATERLIK